MRRLFLPASIVAVVLAATATPAPAAELPDLEQVAPWNVRVEQRGQRWHLGFATAVRNVGAGALRLRGHGSGSGTMAAQQLGEDGLEVLGPAAGTMRYVTTYG